VLLLGHVELKVPAALTSLRMAVAEVDLEFQDCAKSGQNLQSLVVQFKTLHGVGPWALLDHLGARGLTLGRSQQEGFLKRRSVCLYLKQIGAPDLEDASAMLAEVRKCCCGACWACLKLSERLL
jgi:hypothetical protein